MNHSANVTRQQSLPSVAGAAVSALPRIAVTVVTALAAWGCAANTDPGQVGSESIGKTEQALSGLVTASWGGVGEYGGACGAFTNGSPATLNLGVGDGWQCFLSGVFGNTSQGFVSVFRNDPVGCTPKFGSNWVLAIDAVPNAALSASAVCIPGTPTGVTLTTGPAPQTLDSNVNQNTVCGFTSIGSPFTQAFSGFATVSNNGTSAPTFSQDSTWRWNETNPIGGHHQSDATCVTSATGLTFGGDASCAGGVCNNFNVPAGAACFLTSVSGTFGNNSFTDGVGVSPVNSTTWSFRAAPGKSAAVYCVDD